MRKILSLTGASLCLTFIIAAPTGASLGTWYPQIMVVSDYRFDGMSSTDREPTVQLSLYFQGNKDFYGGLWVSGVDYGYPGTPTYEIDIYARKSISLGKVDLSLQAMAANYPDQSSTGPTLNFIQAKTALTYTHKALSLEGTLSWTPDGSSGAGEVGKFRGGVTLALTENIDAVAVYGGVRSEYGQDRDFWELGLVAKTSHLSFDVRYIDTNLSRKECFYLDWCEPAIVSKITYNVPILGFSYLRPK